MYPLNKLGCSKHVNTALSAKGKNWYKIADVKKFMSQ